MIYNLKSISEREKAKSRLEKLIEKGSTIDLTEKKPQRTLPQNNYLHLILTYFAIHHGYTLEETKDNIFKVTCNKDLFVVKKEYPGVGLITTLRSTSSLDTKEMVLAIERFKDFSATNDLQLPNSEDWHFLNHIRNLEKENAQFL